jgi:hypothetical protein
MVKPSLKGQRCNMEKVWFEIGVSDENGETHTILSCDTASKAISIFKDGRRI